MKIRYLTLLTTLVFLGCSVSAFAGKDCPDGDTSPKCNRGGGGDDHGDPPAKYCAQLISGGFDFGIETVTRNNRGNAYNSPHGLIMVRPLVSDSDSRKMARSIGSWSGTRPESTCVRRHLRCAMSPRSRFHAAD